VAGERAPQWDTVGYDSGTHPPAVSRRIKFPPAKQSLLASGPFGDPAVLRVFSLGNDRIETFISRAASSIRYICLRRLRSLLALGPSFRV